MAQKKQDVIDTKQLGVSVALALALGLGGGYLVGNAVGQDHDHTTHSEASLDDNDSDSLSHRDDTAAHSHGGHDIFMVNADEAPTVELAVEKDAKSGYNIAISTTKFTFTPDSVNIENVIGEGHAHLYVDGEKVGRLYGPNFHYDGEINGSATFRVTLNSNMHGEYALGGDVIEDTVTVNEN